VKQYEAVLLTLERPGGEVTLVQRYRKVLKMEEVEWATRTPFAASGLLLNQGQIVSRPIAHG
jgi:hypothetical protein